MKIKIVFKEIKKNGILNSMIILQITIVFILVICCSSIVAYFLEYYRNFSDYFEKEGYVIDTDSVTVSGEKYGYDTIARDTDQIEKELRHADVIGCYGPWVSYKDVSGNSLQFNTIAYDPEIIERYTPELVKGSWLNAGISDDGILEAVVSENAYGIDVGDTFLMFDVMSEQDKPLTVKVVGKLEDGARIVGHIDGSLSKGDYRDLYSDYYLKEQGDPILLFNTKEIAVCADRIGNTWIERHVTGTVIISYSSDISEEDKIFNESYIINHFLFKNKYTMEEIRHNSYASIKERLLRIFPVFLGAFILTVISGMCSCAVSVKKQMRNYAIYSICGMPWQHTVRINLLSSFLTAFFSLGMAHMVSYFALHWKLIDETMISFGAIQLLSCIGVMFFYLVISAIMPYSLINGTSLSEIFHNNE